MEGYQASLFLKASQLDTHGVIQRHAENPTRQTKLALQWLKVAVRRNADTEVMKALSYCYGFHDESHIRMLRDACCGLPVAPGNDATVFSDIKSSNSPAMAYLRTIQKLGTIITEEILERANIKLTEAEKASLFAQNPVKKTD